MITTYRKKEYSIPLYAHYNDEDIYNDTDDNIQEVSHTVIVKKTVSPFVGIGLFILSVVLAFIFIPFGIIYSFFFLLFKPKHIGDYFMSCAKIIDIAGNVILQYPLNHLLMKKGGYKYGDEQETISGATGKNKQRDSQSDIGIVLSNFLDWIDPNHVLNSINYFVERDNNYIQSEKELEEFKLYMSRKYNNVDFENLKLR